MPMMLTNADADASGGADTVGWSSDAEAAAPQADEAEANEATCG